MRIAAPGIWSIAAPHRHPAPVKFTMPPASSGPASGIALRAVGGIRPNVPAGVPSLTALPASAGAIT